MPNKSALEFIHGILWTHDKCSENFKFEKKEKIRTLGCRSHKILNITKPVSIRFHQIHTDFIQYEISIIQMPISFMFRRVLSNFAFEITRIK